MSLNILYVDDERSAHTIFRHSLGVYQDMVDVSYHFDYQSAMAYAQQHEIDCAFLDISLTDRDGIALARDLRGLHPRIEFAFITGYDEFARAAYEVGGRAYLTKPYGREELHQALALMQRLTQPWLTQRPQGIPNHPHIFMKTFGSFDLLIDGVPVYFKHSKAKELLAYLVHQVGGSVTSAQVFYTLWDHQAYTRDNSTYVRRTLRLLKEELESLGISHILISMRNSIRVDTQYFFCDAYGLLHGNQQAIDAFAGVYMRQYPWAEMGLPLLKKAAEEGQVEENTPTAP